MFTIRFVTEEDAPGQTVLLRWAPDWNVDRGGVYTGGAWTFDIDETKFPFGIQFKFVLAPGRWSDDPNLFLAPGDMVGVKDYGPGGRRLPAKGRAGYRARGGPAAVLCPEPRP